MIKIQNIYHMLAYAFQVLNKDSYADLATEEFDYIGNLLAAILAKGIANQIKRGLGREYINKSETINTPAGKINVSESIKQLSFLRKQLVCSFDEFTENDYLNQILKATATLLIKSPDVASEQKKLLKRIMFYFNAVDDIDPKRIQWSSIKYNRNNATYKMLINICYLVIKGLLLDEKDGNRKLAEFLDDQNMHRLYEKFILEYYRKHYPQYNASPAQIAWDIDDNMVEFLPMMKSDITLKFNGKTVIIDAKYYGKTMQLHNLFNSKTLHSHNMYQIFTYVKNKDVTNSGNVSGILLYAKTDEEIVPDNEYLMSGNKISVKTLDLNNDFSIIEEQLGQLVACL